MADATRCAGAGYAATMASPDELPAATRAFTEAFDRNDLDGVMAWLTDDVVYEQHDGRVAEGRDTVRAAFEPQFAGAFGRMWFAWPSVPSRCPPAAPLPSAGAARVRCWARLR